MFFLQQNNVRSPKCYFILETQIKLFDVRGGSGTYSLVSLWIWHLYFPQCLYLLHCFFLLCCLAPISPNHIHPLTCSRWDLSQFTCSRMLLHLTTWQSRFPPAHPAWSLPSMMAQQNDASSHFHQYESLAECHPLHPRLALLAPARAAVAGLDAEMIGEQQLDDTPHPPGQEVFPGAIVRSHWMGGGAVGHA